MSQANDDLAFLAGSPTRVELLEQLATDGACSRSGLFAESQASRRTLKRALDALHDRGWVIETGDRYRLTALGAGVYDAYASLDAVTTVGGRLGPVLELVPAETFGLDVAALAEAEVVVATESSPYAPIDRVLSLRRGAGRIRELSSVVAKESAEQLADRVRDGAVEEVEVVLERDVVDTVEDNQDYRSTFWEFAGAEPVAVYVTDRSFPYLVAIADDTVAIGVTDGGQPHAVAVCQTAAVREWAEEVYEEYRAGATRLRP